MHDHEPDGQLYLLHAVPARAPVEGYWCVVCMRFIPDEDGVMAHDNVPHPSTMTFDDDDNPQ